MTTECDHRDSYGSTIIFVQDRPQDGVCMLCDKEFPALRALPTRTGQEPWLDVASRILDFEGPAALAEWEAKLTDEQRAEMDRQWQAFVEALRAMGRNLR